MADDAPTITVTVDDAGVAHPAGITEMNGKLYMEDANGVMKPLSMVKAADKLEDEMVRRVFGFAEALSEQIARFRGYTFDDVDEFMALLNQDAGLTKKGGGEGNVTFTSYDGRLKVKVAMVKLITFGPQLQQAKKLVDECLVDWTTDGPPEVEAIISNAFNVDQEGKINRAALLGLRRLAITDPRWLRAMELIHDAERTIGKKRYVNFYRRADQASSWEHVSIDVASA